MDKVPSLTTVIAGFIIILFGLVNIALGVIAVISSISPDLEGKFTVPAINLRSIILGLTTVVAGSFLIVGGVGHAFLREWASKLSLYVSISIIAVNVAGVLHLWGFVIKSGYAVLTMVVGIGIIWYLSKRELASFFLLSAAEHVFVIIAVIMLIYSKPLESLPEDKGITVTLEEIRQKEPESPPVKIVIPQKKKKEVKKEEPAELPTLPKLKIQKVTGVDSGAKTADSLPQLPRTFARITDAGADMVLRSPGQEKSDQRKGDIIPTLGLESAFKSSKKLTFGVVSPPGGGKGKPGTAVGEEPGRARGDLANPVEQTGTLSGVAKPGFVGDIRGEVAGRKVVSWPKSPEELKGTEGGSTTLEILVDPAGNVTKVKITKKSGNPKLDKIAMEYVLQIRFEELPKNVAQKVQRGEVLINFEVVK